MFLRASRLTRSPHALLRWCLGVGLWLLVLLAQQASWQHALSHVTGVPAAVPSVAQPLPAGAGVHVAAHVGPHAEAHAGLPPDSQLAPGHVPVNGDLGHDKACQDCLAFHAGAHALPAHAAALLPVNGAVAVRPAAALAQHLVAISLAYQSRAPPFRV